MRGSFHWGSRSGVTWWGNGRFILRVGIGKFRRWWNEGQVFSAFHISNRDTQTANGAVHWAALLRS